MFLTMMMKREIRRGCQETKVVRNETKRIGRVDRNCGLVELIETADRSNRSKVVWSKDFDQKLGFGQVNRRTDVWSNHIFEINIIESF